MRLTLCLITTAAAFSASVATPAGAGRSTQGIVRVTLRSDVIDLFHSASVRVSGTRAGRVEARLLGAIDEAGLAYEWAPYRWRPLQRVHGTWQGLLPAPPLFGIYQLELRLGRSPSLLSSARWLLRVFPRGATARPSFATPAAAIRNYVAHLPGDEVLKALRRWPQAKFDHRDPRLNRIFAIAYAPRGKNASSPRLGLFVTTVREGFHGQWRVLQATTQPYG